MEFAMLFIVCFLLFLFINTFIIEFPENFDFIIEWLKGDKK